MESNIQRSLGRIEGKLDSIQKQQEDIIKCTKTNTDDISQIKQKQSYSAGQASIWGIIGGAIITTVVSLIKNLK
jgi:hypothetical protein